MGTAENERAGKQVPLVYGHRGASADAPENTLAAFGLLKTTGARGVELDVWLCASGEIVVAHDADLKRTAGVDLRIREATLSELRRHDVGSWFAGEFKAERIPLLTEVFDLLGREFYYDIEIKPYGLVPGQRTYRIETLLCDLILDRNLRDRCVVSSFDPFVVRRFRNLGSGISTALIYAQRSNMPFLLRGGRGRIVCDPDVLKPHHVEVSRELVEREHGNGKRIIPWTVDDGDRAKELASFGVDGIISNVPALIVGTLAGAAGDSREV